MKVSLEWLSQYVDLPASEEDLAQRLTMAGLEVEEIIRLGDEVVFDVAVTSNRPDCLCVTGVAREVAALYGVPLRMPEIEAAESAAAVEDLTSVEIADADLCPRYCARVISGCKVGPSPPWMVRRLEAVGLRSINNVVDVSNYVLMELGHPLHAFDYDKLAENRIVVRRARAGESITSLDGEERKLSPDMLVIADAAVPVAVAGVMGGLDSEVTLATTNVLLESAYFDPPSIRRTSRALGMPTEASYRFERGADLGGLVPAIDRTAQLVLELAGGELARGVFDAGCGDPAPVRITLRKSRVDLLLGDDISLEEAGGYLGALGLSVEPGPDGAVTCEVPSFRRDLGREVDLIEEVARLRGYDSFAPVRPAVPMLSSHVDPLRRLCREARRILPGCGLSEAVNFSWGHADDFPFTSDEVIVARIDNPLGDDSEALRPALLPGLISSVGDNISRRVTDVGLFEIGSVFARRGDGAVVEQRHIGIAVTGEWPAASWRGGGGRADFYALKGIVEVLLARLGVSGVTFEAVSEEGLAEGTAALIRSGDCVLGVMGQAEGVLTGRHGIDQPVFVAEVNAGSILAAPKRGALVEPPPRFPAALRDIAVVVRAGVSCADVESVVCEAGGDLVERVRLFDVYSGKQVPAGHRSLAFSITYRAADRTLTDEEVGERHEGILFALAERLGAELRA